MSISISTANGAQSHTAQVVAVESAVPATTAPKTGIPTQAQAAANDTVQISGAAQAALKESIESPAQTAREANAGDVQAKRLLTKEAADKIG